MYQDLLQQYELDYSQQGKLEVVLELEESTVLMIPEFSKVFQF